MSVPDSIGAPGDDGQQIQHFRRLADSHKNPQGPFWPLRLLNSCFILAESDFELAEMTAVAVIPFGNQFFFTRNTREKYSLLDSHHHKTAAAHG